MGFLAHPPVRPQKAPVAAGDEGARRSYTSGRARTDARRVDRSSSSGSARAVTVSTSGAGVHVANTHRGRAAMRDDARGETSALLASRDDDAVESMEQARRVSSRSASSTRTSVMCTVAAIAAAAAIGVWTHKSKTLQEAWRPVPGAELVTGGDERSMITRWSKTGKTMASLGQSFTGVTPTPSQLTALKALRLQVRTAMFSPGGISPETLNLLSSRFGAIVPQASSLFPSGKPDTIDQLDSAIKTLLAIGTPAAPAAPAAESEFRGMLPSGDRPTIASGEETDAASEVPTSGRSKPPRKPLTQYESALLETKAAANAVASTGAYNHKSKSMSSETQTVRQNDNLERMINSLDPKGGSSSGGSVMSDISSYDVDANDIFSRSPGQAPSGDFVQYSENAPSPRKRRARRSKEAQEEPQTGDADSLPPWAHGAPPNEAASQQLAAAQPAPQPAPVEEDTSWTSFQEQLPGDTPTPSESPSPSPSPTPSPSPEPEPSGLPLPSLFPSTSPEPSEDPEPNPTRPTDPIGIDNLLGFNDDSPHVDETAPPPAPEPDTAQDDDAAVESLFKDGVGDKEESGSSELGEDDDVTGGAYGVGGGLQPKIMKPVQANANAKAIASHIVDMIMRRKSTMEDGGDGADANADADAASIGLTEGKTDDVEAKKVSPNLSKEQIAEELADSLTAMTTEAVEANALQSARMADSMNGSPSAKIMADALVEHDKKMAKRIAQILKSDDPEAKLTNGVGDDTAAMGAGVGTAGAQRGRSGEAAQLIMYEEQRRQRDEIEAMRRDLASLMANIQANYAMGVTQGRIDKTASQAASHIIDTLRPVLNKDAVAREGSSETDSLKVFDYPILASSTLSSDGLRLDAGEHESDDADDVDAESSYDDDVADKKAKKKGAGAKQAGDDDDFLGSILGSSGDSKSSLSHKASGASGAKTASTAAASDDDGLSLPAFSSSSDDQPGWLAHAPTDEQLTAQFLADDDDSGKKKSKKHESKKSKRRAATLGAVERPREGAYIRALNERAERALG